MNKNLKILILLLLFIVLTVLTQVGGIILIISIWISHIWKSNIKYKKPLVFVFLYTLFTLVIIPFIAPLFGRERIQNTKTIRPVSFITILLNRNYVKSDLNELLKSTAKNLEGSNIQIKYLDANFPFINKFPLLPHLSHNDGEKLDISLIYQLKSGLISNSKKSLSGYGVFENPQPNEIDQTAICKQAGYFQYDYPKYLTFGEINKELEFSLNGNKKLISSLLSSPLLGKMFIEPHLKQRLNLTDTRVRFHGCGAVRHDDHIHVQLK